jgi:translation initiation factor 4E
LFGLKVCVSVSHIYSCIANLTEWVLWEHAGGAKRDANAWKDSMKELCSFSTVEDFWRYFNHIPRVSQVFYDGDTKKRVGPNNKVVEEYSLFKKGIEPEWGDSKNQTGGEWFWRCNLDSDVLDLFWTNLVLAVIGETLEDPTSGAHVNGARVLDKGKNYPIFKIELWIDTKDATVKEKIRARLVDIIAHGLPAHKMARNHPKFEWKDHS